MSHVIKTLVRALARAVPAWLSDQAPRLAAGLAYYTSFSIAPLLFLVILLTGAVYADAEAEVLGRLTSIIPGGGVEAVRILLQGLRRDSGSGLAAGLGMLTLAFGATGVFIALQDALNQIWAVELRPRFGWARFLLRRLFSFAMVLVVAFLLLVSLVVNSVLAVLVARFGGLLPGGEVLWHAINVLVALGAAVGIFSLVFKYVPDAPVRWPAALAGGMLTAALFAAGEVVLAWYIGAAAYQSVYGAFGSLIVLLVWVYYSAQIVLFGAEFTKAYDLLSTPPVTSNG